MGKGNTTAKPLSLADEIIADLKDPQRNDLRDYVEGRTACNEGLKLFPIAQVSAVYGVSIASLRNHAQSGELRVVRFGSSYQVSVKALRDFIRGREKTSIITSKKFGHPGRAMNPGQAMTKKLTKRKRPTTKAKTARATTPRPSKQSGGNS